MYGSRLPGAAERLWDLIARRAERGADTEAIDRRIWDLFGERWAVVFTDLSGFSRRVEEFGIIHFLQTIYEHKKLVLPIVTEHDGYLVKSEGDSLMLLFRRVQSALDCAIEMQRACESASARRTPEEKILLCVGIGWGDILRIGEEDLWGREVNAASKLGEDMARSGEILVTRATRDEALAAGGGDYRFEPLDRAVSGSDENFRLLRPER